jgi:hypothetical protein
LKDVTIIPKDCCLCDVCNKQLTDGQFIAIEYCFWYEGWLYCDACNKEYKPMKELSLIMEIHKGVDLSQTDLAKPIVMEFGD